MNTFEFQDSGRTRSFKARVTDTALESLSPPLMAFFGARAGVPLIQRRDGTPPTTAATQPMLLPPDEDLDGHAEGGLPSSAAPDNEFGQTSRHENDAVKLRDIFRRDGERLRLDNSSLKATGQLDFAQRLSLLFLYAHASDGREDVRRSALNELLIEAGVYDGNFRSWIARNPFILQNGDMLRLIVPGRERARAILYEVSDPSLSDKWTLGSKTASRKGRSKSAPAMSESEGSKAGPKRAPIPKRVGEWVSGWKALGQSLPVHDILATKGNLEKALLGLWAIRKAAGDKGKEVSAAYLCLFLWEAFELKAHERSLQNTLASESGKGTLAKVGRVSSYVFQITPPGMQFANAMVGSVPSAEAVTAPPRRSRKHVEGQP